MSQHSLSLLTGIDSLLLQLLHDLPWKGIVWFRLAASIQFLVKCFKVMIDVSLQRVLLSLDFTSHDGHASISLVLERG